MEFVDILLKQYGGRRLTEVFKKTLVIILILKQLMFLLFQPSTVNPEEIADFSCEDPIGTYLFTDLRSSIEETSVIELLQSLKKINMPESSFLGRTSSL